MQMNIRHRCSNVKAIIWPLTTVLTSAYREIKRKQQYVNSEIHVTLSRSSFMSILIHSFIRVHTNYSTTQVNISSKLYTISSVIFIHTRFCNSVPSSGSTHQSYIKLHWNIEIRVMELRKMRWTPQAASMWSVGDWHRILVDRRDGKRKLWSPRRNLVEHVRMMLKAIGFKDVDWIRLCLDSIQ